MIELSLAAFSAAFLLVVLAEMGDKTQFVAMTFAAKYNPFKVLFAIFLGTVTNFAIVIVLWKKIGLGYITLVLGLLTAFSISAIYVISKRQK